MLLRMHVNDHTVNDLTIYMFLSILFYFFFYNFMNFNQNVIPWSSVETRIGSDNVLLQLLKE